MSGKIKLKARKGKSLDNRYKYYPEAYLELTDENMKDKIKLSPSYNDLKNMIIEFRKHELKVDHTRKRKNYTSKLISMMEKLLEELKQIKLTEYNHIEKIYKEQNEN